MRNSVLLIMLVVAIPLVSSGGDPAPAQSNHGNCDEWRGSLDNRTNLIAERLNDAHHGCAVNLGGTPGEAETGCCGSAQNDCSTEAGKGYCRGVRNLRDVKIKGCMKEVQKNSDALAAERRYYKDRCEDCVGECGTCSIGMTAVYMKHSSCPSGGECWVCQ